MWSTWKKKKNHKYLTFKPGSSQNRIFSEETDKRMRVVFLQWKSPIQNGRVGTYVLKMRKKLVS